MFKDLFPKHCDWEEPGWIKRMTGGEFMNNYNHEQVKVNVDVSDDTNHGIYSKSLP